jgi:tetratricopeptide (TPR) repeat protein
MTASESPTPGRPERTVGRRRRRLYWTIAVLVAAALLGTAVGYSIYRANRPETYRTGEAHAEITRRLELRLPEETPEPRLVDVTEAAGLGGFRSFVGTRTSQLPEDMGAGAAWGDFDNDGDDDLFLVSMGGPLDGPEADRAPSQLYENVGDGTFARVESFPETRILGMGAAWGDYDNDGWLDLVVAGFDSLRLFHNDQGRLERSSAIEDREGYWSGASWADFDRDGDLDLYVCGYVRYFADPNEPVRTSQQYGQAVAYTLNPASFEPATNLLLRNDGRGSFADVAESLGVHNPDGRSLGALWQDFDDDGWPDLYIANDISDNALFMNREGSFEDVSHAAWVADYRGAMGLAAGDWNRDGDDDLFVSHWVAQENALYDSLLRDLEKNPEMQHSGLRFMDVADQRGLGQIALQVVGWGAAFADFDADGWLDLAVVNGSTFETAETPKRLKPHPSFFFWNHHGKAFHDLASMIPSLSTPHVSRGLALADYDNDGDVDLLITDLDAGARLLRNDIEVGNWLEVRLRTTAGEIVDGARLVARAGDARLRRTVSSASYLSQNSRTVHFGLGRSIEVEELEIRWPDGTRDVHEGLGHGTIWELTKGESEPRSVAAAAPAAGIAAPSLTDKDRLRAFWSKQRAAMRTMKVDQDPETAIGLFREALALNPVHEDSLYYLGNCLATTGDVEGALAQLGELMRLNPMSHRAHKRWGTLRAVTAGGVEDMDAAVAALERAYDINKEETGVLLALGEVDTMRGDFDGAREILELMVRTNPQADEAFFILGYLAWKRNEESRAREMLQQAHDARQEEWKPEGAVAEGEVKHKMHTEASPLLPYFESWDGTLDPERAFGALDTYLASIR